ncbi:ATP-binding protein [Streptomyces sp. NPDC058000]|uniref:ATP-binding protein n=1 Tax=Streptomyces sp. NPDC058000 TaxID=3346299 RepID=UPI0036E03418
MEANTSGDAQAPPCGSAEFVLPLPHAAQHVGSVRSRARNVLGNWDLPSDAADDALLVISELVTNAVTHALPPAVLRLSSADRQRGLRIEVTDGGRCCTATPGHRRTA